MYAIVRTGGKQYKVAPGEVIRVEKLSGEVGQGVELTEVLLVSQGEEVVIGQPLVESAKVKAVIVEQGRYPKVVVFKKKRRKNYKKKYGHRQPYTALKIEEILLS
ncbi:50S ribosomal protein L21 [Thermosulfuriphilus ammonigenes]|uniref:Large ribosomal subunit protein bL21 n=1 Tax=Thermosulfuriphilus ammonigenes TaxID=1936021 RepID=A0A6G7PYQ2_9BACT|nr:50S ribosomal protein L21 [Thermosulfuriphilus ammonigenes]MBA2849466.1 large subunit ribosomal protein L21 [Thermosulfuriphilus ammonigenes]QIJ72533.1 50S ribosomal protein L21 [Thermosulfuriphilus ammonigenes]